jgi:hypothetical protein
MKKIGWPGKGYKFSCHRCGFWYPSTEIRQEWSGLSVCDKCWEPRHPQTLIKVHGESAFPKIVSKDGIDTYIPYCDLTTKSGYANLGTADCMQASNTTYTYAFLFGLNDNGHGVP